MAGDVRTNVQGSTHARVVGASTSIVEDDRHERVGRNLSVQAGHGYVVRVGEASGPDNPNPQLGELSLRSTGTLSAAADQRVVISADQSLTLVCGEARIEMSPRGITLSAPSVVAIGTESFVAAGKGPTLDLGEHAKLFTQELQILTKSGSLEMTDATVLKGSSIKLERPKAQSKDRSSDPPDTTRVRVQLTDARHRPYADCRFQARAEELRTEGSTDSEGFVELVVPKKAKRATLTVWTGPYPTGERKEHVLILAELPDIELLAGVQVRLRNLGYYRGTTAGEFLDDATRYALRDFQLDNGLPPTGEPDTATQRALVTRHGH